MCSRGSGVAGRGQVEGQSGGQPEHGHARADADAALVLAVPLDPFRDSAAGQSEEEEGDGGAGREGDGEHHGVQPDLSGRSGHRDRREDRARAGDVGRAEQQAEDESVGPLADVPVAEVSEGLLEPFLGTSGTSGRFR